MDMLDHFAERLSRHDVRTGDHGGDVTRAAASLGQTRAWGQKMLRRLTERMGDQAQ